jgi:hypothetical protein
MSYQCCKEFFIPQCTETLTLACGLEATTDYIVSIYKYSIREQFNIQVTSNGDGELAIDLTDSVFPEGLFNKSAGLFKLFVVEDISDTVNQVLTFGGDNPKEYDCVEFEFNDCVPNETGFTIQ